LIKHYNEERLHASLDYMTPVTWHRGQPDQVRERRAGRIAAAPAHIGKSSISSDCPRRPEQ
jgi:hypothetical protein